MKRQAVPQFEFGFSGDSFALVPEKQSAPSAPVIMAEMTPEEREKVRQTAIVQERLGRSYVVDGGELHLTGKMGRPISDANQTESEAAAMAEARTPGLREGSYWSPMTKAPATVSN